MSLYSDLNEVLTPYANKINDIKANLDERLDRYNLFFYPINSFTQKITENTIIDENGSEVANTNNHTTDFIKYRPGSTLIIKNGSTPANITYLAYYGRELQFISRSSMYPSTGTGIILPDDTEYIRVCYKTTLTNLSVFMDYVVNSYPAIPIPETRNPNAFCPSDYGYEADTDISDWCNYIISVYPNPMILIDNSYYIDKTVTLTDGVSFKGTSRKSLIRRRNDVIMFKSYGSPYNSEKTITVDGESVQTYTEGTRRFITFSDIQIYSDSNAILFTNPIFDLKGVTLSNFVRMIISCNGKHFRCAQLQDSSFVDCHFFNSGDITSSANVTSYPSFDLKMFVYKSYPADTVIDETTYPEGYVEYFMPVNQLTFDRCTWESYRGECFITDGYSNDIAFTGCKFESVPHVGSIIYAASQQESEKATGILSNWKFDNCVITAHAVAQKPLLDLRGAYNCTFGIKFAVENNYTYPFISFSSIYAIGNTFSIKIRFKSSGLSLGAYVVDIGNKTNLHRALLLAKNNFAVKRFYLPGGLFKTTIVAPVTSNIPDSALWSVGDYVPDITNLTNGWVCTSVNPAVFEELKDFQSQIGDLADLETSDKSNLVAAINEAAQSGGGGGGGSSTLSGLTDTSISNKTDGQVLTYDGTSNKWVNRAPSGGSTITVDSVLSTTSTNPVQNKVIKQALDSKAGTDVATTSANGLMSATDKSHLDSVYADYSAAIAALGA